MICIDLALKSDPINKMAVTDHQFVELRQQIMAIEVICRHLLLEHNRNNVSIVVCSGPFGAQSLLKHSCDMSLISKTLYTLCEYVMDRECDFIKGLTIASQLLEMTCHSVKLLLILVNNRIQCTDYDLSLTASQCFSKFQTLSVYLVSIGSVILRNRPKFEIIRRVLERQQKTLYLTEVKEFQAKEFLMEIMETPILELGPSHMKSFKDEVNDLEKCNTYTKSSEYQIQLIQLEKERNDLIKNKEMDEATKATVMQILEQNIKDLKTSIGINTMQTQTDEVETVGPNHTTMEDLDLERAIQMSILENNKNDSSMKQNLKDNSGTVVPKQKKKVKKFKEGIKDD